MNLGDGLRTLVLLAQEHAPEGGGDEATRLVLPAIDELIWGAIAFTILFVALSKFAFPALRKGLEAREQAIRSELERAEQARLEAESKREEYDRLIADARNEADRIIREATEQAEGLKRERVEKAEEEARALIDKARQEASQERDRAFAELQRTVADLTLEAASRVIDQELSDPAAQRRLVEQFIASTTAGSTG